jgi:hypothetical protein
MARAKAFIKSTKIDMRKIYTWHLEILKTTSHTKTHRRWPLNIESDLPIPKLESA